MAASVASNVRGQEVVGIMSCFDSPPAGPVAAALWNIFDCVSGISFDTILLSDPLQGLVPREVSGSPREHFYQNPACLWPFWRYLSSLVLGNIWIVF